MDSRDKPENDCVGGAILGAKQPAKDPDWENSQTWRVGFSIPTPAFFKRRSRRKIEPVRSGYWNADKGPLWVRDPLPLARRLEAIIRVMENPAPYAIRLARRLEKLKRTNMGPELLIKSLLKMPAMPTRMDQLRPAGLSALQESQALAREAAAHFRGSG